MSDLDPVMLFFILYEGMGGWLWVLLGLALLLLAGVAASALRLHRACRPIKRPLLAALFVGLIVAAASTFAVPVWTLAGPDALAAAVDYAIAFMLGLVPGAIAGAVVFMIAASQCKRAEPGMP